MAIVFPLFFSSSFGIFIKIHEYANKIIFIRPLTSKHLSYDSTGSVTKCHSDSLGLKLVYLWNVNVFLSF